jgi:hypothetical protein
MKKSFIFILSAAKVKFSHVLFPILEPILLWSKSATLLGTVLMQQRQLP